MMDLLERTAKHFPLDITGKPFQKHELERINIVRELVMEIKRQRRALEWIASCEGGDIFDLWKEMRKTAQNALKEIK